MDKQIVKEAVNKGVCLLGEAKVFGDLVSGTSGGSKYVYMASVGKAQMALRLKNQTLSIRVEPLPTLKKQVEALQLLGLDLKDSYGSCHVKLPDDMAKKRFSVFMTGVLSGWELPQTFNIDDYEGKGA